MTISNQTIGLAALTALTTASLATAEIGHYYIGIDNAETLTYGVYSGEENPNQGRLTFLFYHTNHFHSIGSYYYAEDNGELFVTDTNANNQLPESYTGYEPISLLPGTGAFDGTYLSGLASDLDQDAEYGDFTIQNVHSLEGVDDVTYNSSNGRWNTSFDNAHLHMTLVNATTGLKIAFGNSPTDSLVVGGDVHVGEGNEMFVITPTFWVEGDAPIGSTYTAEFILEDLSNTYADSGRFFLNFQVVPEPASFALLGIGSLLATRYRSRNLNA